MHVLVLLRDESALGGFSESSQDGAVGDHAADRNPRGLPNDQEFVFSSDGCAIRKDLLNVPQRSAAGS